MKKRIIADNTVKLNNILKAIKDFKETDERKLVTWLVEEKGYDLKEIAVPLGVSPQALSLRYPGLKKEVKS